MKKSLKIASVAVILILVLGVVAFVYANSQIAANTDNDKNTSTNFGLRTRAQKHLKLTQPEPNAGLEGLKRFIEHANATEISGTVVSELKGMLILDTGEGHVRILLPESWSLDNEVVSRGKLFNGTFSALDQTVTVKILKSELFQEDSFGINVMLGHEIINATGTQAYAVLPFNIEPNS